MLAIERRNEILEKLQIEKKVVVSELSQLFRVSEETIRRDLEKLEKDGLVERHVYPVVPPKVEYELTDFGQTVLPILDAMCVWGREYLDDQRKKDREKS